MPNQQQLKKIKSAVHGLKHYSTVNAQWPRWMYFMFDKCNSRCKTCNIWRQKPCSNPATPSQLRSILQSELFKNIEYFGITGGEATLYDLYSYLHVAHEALPKAVLTVSSNGLLPGRLYETVKACLKEDIQIGVGLSLDGVGEFHDEWRGVKGNFAKVDWLIHKFKELQKRYPQFTFGAGSTLTVETAMQVDKLSSYCKRLRVPFMWHWFNYAPFYHNAPREIDQRLFTYAVLKGMDRSIYRNMWLNYLRTGKFPKVKCQALSSYLLLGCDGEVKPCLNMWNYSAGNMLKTDPIKVWASKEAVSVRRKVALCNGCLNKWAVDWNLVTSYPQYLLEKAVLRLRQ